jgi:hypothetical protein
VAFLLHAGWNGTTKELNRKKYIPLIKNQPFIAIIPKSIFLQP